MQKRKERGIVIDMTQYPAKIKRVIKKKNPNLAYW